MTQPEQHPNRLILSLEELLKEADGKDVSLEMVCHTLSGRGYPVLMALLSFPFCLPITLPGLSTAFGLILAFMGLRIAFGHHLWWPKKLLDKNVSYDTLQGLVKKVIVMVQKIRWLLYPRLEFLSQNMTLHRLHGATIALMAFLLMLPLPIPFTNTLSALPILCISLGLLEDDGVLILIGYFLALIAIVAFFALFWFGSKEIYHLVY